MDTSNDLDRLALDYCDLCEGWPGDPHQPCACRAPKAPEPAPYLDLESLVV